MPVAGLAPGGSGGGLPSGHRCRQSHTTDERGILNLQGQENEMLAFQELTKIEVAYLLLQDTFKSPLDGDIGQPAEQALGLHGWQTTLEGIRPSSHTLFTGQTWRSERTRFSQALGLPPAEPLGSFRYAPLLTQPRVLMVAVERFGKGEPV